MSALSHQREVGGPINSIIPFLADNSRIFYFFKNYFQYSIHDSQLPKSYQDYSKRLFGLSFTSHYTVTSGYQLIVDNHCFIQFTIFKDCFDMFTNVLLGDLEEFS